MLRAYLGCIHRIALPFGGKRSWKVLAQAVSSRPHSAKLGREEEYTAVSAQDGKFHLGEKS
jgi:hypothetical protein